LKLIGTILLLLLLLGFSAANAQIPYPNPIKHVVVLFQENRTPDNLFQGLLTWPGVTPGNYVIASSGVNSAGQTIPLVASPFGNHYDLSHAHSAFVAQYDGGKMDGADKVPCYGTCPANPQFVYVDNSTHQLDPYLTLATQYGWANYFFSTHQGGSFPGHQFIFAGTSATSVQADALGLFVAEQPRQPANSTYNAGGDTGCLAPLGEWNYVLHPDGSETQLINNPLGKLCFSHNTMGSVLDKAGLRWKYYTVPSQGTQNVGGSIWTAPNSIRQICQPNSTYTLCRGPDWTSSVDLNSADVLKDIKACNLPSASWVIPSYANSDHPGSTKALGGTGGPSWVASIVNAIGGATACDGGAGYWSDTVILVTWDDWGGWYDHVAPPILGGVQGDYQYGFRVPLLVISGYTPQAFVYNANLDYGSILRFMEGVFNITEGAIGFADARASDDLGAFFNFQAHVRPFTNIAAPLNADFFINDKSRPEPPDND
jgi:phospholipase C